MRNTNLPASVVSARRRENSAGSMRVWMRLVLTGCIALMQPVSAQSAFTPPIVAPDGTVTLRVAAPNALSVQVSGDFGPRPAVMKRDITGTWTAKLGPLKPDLYGYTFIIDGQSVPDPSNTNVKVGAYWFGSLVEVPGRETAYLDASDVPHGVVHEHSYYSDDLKTVRRVVIYTPPGYERNVFTKYPALYLLHGYGDDETNWTTVGRANIIMDNLVAGGETVPALIVMPYCHRISRDGWTGAYNSTLADEARTLEDELERYIVPLVEKNYRVRTDRENRAIAGISMGGFQALSIGLGNTDRFAWVAGFSSALYQPLQSDALIEDASRAGTRLRLLRLGCGSLDSFLGANLAFDRLLTSKGIRHEWVETPGYDHGWLLWRPYLRDLLSRLFRRK